MVSNLERMAHTNLCVSIDNIAVVWFSVTVLYLFIVAKRNSKLKPEQNDSGWTAVKQ